MSSPASTLTTGVSSGASTLENSTKYDDSRAGSGASDNGSTAPIGFAAFGLPTAILRAIRDLGYETPTAIQQEAIPALLLGCDVTGVAQTGTGKTAAYGLPLLTLIDPTSPGVQALVLVPTRELAIQVTDALAGFAAKIPAVGIVAIYGGAPISKQINALKRGAQVVVGTPGRVIDLIERKSLRLEHVTFAVLDEADEMLRMGFAEDVDRILTEVPAQRQTALFSATMPKEIRRVAARHLRQPVDVSVAASATPVTNIDQKYIVLPYRDKTLALQRMIAVSDAEAAVVFVRTRNACDELGSALITAGVKAAFISGDVSQNERERTIDRLRGGQIDVLVATDVAARGMDVERIGLVVNYDVPADAEIYIHRIGRTGRAGRSGSAITFFTPKETSRLRVIEKTIGRKLEEITVPSAAQVLDRQAEAALAKAMARHAIGTLTNYANAVAVAADIAGLTQGELAAALLATLVGDDGTPAVEIKSTYSSRNDRDRDRGRSDSRGRDRNDGPRERHGSYERSRPVDRNRDSAPHRGRDDRFERPRRDSQQGGFKQGSQQGGFKQGGQQGGFKQGGQHRDQPWASPSRDDGRTWDSPRHDQGDNASRGGYNNSNSNTGYSASNSESGRSKPRWDSARRAERGTSYEPRSDSRNELRNDSRGSGTWAGNDGANRGAVRADRQGPSRNRATGQRRGQRSVA
ncbi:MAG: DEAD/DEAH box helicase [Nakamurella sp.]